MKVPNDKVGVLIGKAGDTIRSLQDNSGAKIQIVLELVGSMESIRRAETSIKDVIAEADAGGSTSLVARGFNIVQAASGGEQVDIPVPVDRICLIIGRGGETIRNVQTKSGAQIQLMKQNPGDRSMKKVVRVSGSKKQIEIATEMIEDVIKDSPSVLFKDVINLQPAPILPPAHTLQQPAPILPSAHTLQLLAPILPLLQNYHII